MPFKAICVVVGHVLALYVITSHKQPLMAVLHMACCLQDNSRVLACQGERLCLSVCARGDRLGFAICDIRGLITNVSWLAYALGFVVALGYRIRSTIFLKSVCIIIALWNVITFCKLLRVER